MCVKEASVSYQKERVFNEEFLFVLLVCTINSGPLRMARAATTFTSIDAMFVMDVGVGQTRALLSAPRRSNI